MFRPAADTASPIPNPVPGRLRQMLRQAPPFENPGAASKCFSRVIQVARLPARSGQFQAGTPVHETQAAREANTTALRNSVMTTVISALATAGFSSRRSNGSATYRGPAALPIERLRPGRRVERVRSRPHPPHERYLKSNPGRTGVPSF